MRNTKDKMGYIEELIKENETLIVVVMSPQKTVEIAKRLGKRFPDLFKMGSIVLYNEYLDPVHMKRIENMIRKNRVKVMVTTPSVANVPLQESEVNILYYDAPRFPDELLTPIYAVNGKMIVVHLIFGDKDVEDNIEMMNSLFPDRVKITRAWEIIRQNLKNSKGIQNGDEVAKKLLERGIIFRKSHLKILLNILEDVEAFKRKKINGLEESLRYREGFLERDLIDRFGKRLMKSNAKEFFKFISDPSNIVL